MTLFSIFFLLADNCMIFLICSGLLLHGLDLLCGNCIQFIGFVCSDCWHSQKFRAIAKTSCFFIVFSSVVYGNKLYRYSSLFEKLFFDQNPARFSGSRIFEIGVSGKIWSALSDVFSQGLLPRTGRNAGCLLKIRVVKDRVGRAFGLLRKISRGNRFNPA